MEQRHEKSWDVDELRKPALWYAGQRRPFFAIAAFSVLAGLAFFYLHSGRIEGGAFVSLLTLAFGVGLVTLIWHRITHITILGSEIKLQRLTKEAETLVGELDAGKADLYRTALSVMKHSPLLQEDEGEALGERASTLVELLGNIEKAQLLKVLDAEALSTADKIIDELVRNMSDQADLPVEHHSKSLSSRAEAIIAQFEEDRSSDRPQGILGTNDNDLSSKQVKAVDSLRYLLRYRHKIEHARQSSVE
nr:hypothetical protein [uncultured Halomonas sp.]